MLDMKEKQDENLIADYPSTRIQINNQSSTTLTITRVDAPSLTSQPKNQLAMFSSDTLESKSTSYGDYGGISYSQCQLFWSKKREGGRYVFQTNAQALDPRLSCTSQTMVSDPNSGDFRVEFKITKR